MRSFVYLPLISTIVSLAFAMKTQEENTPVSAGEETPEVIEPAPVSGQYFPPGDEFNTFVSYSAQPPFAGNPSENPLPPGSSGRKSKYGYLCQGSLYRLQHLKNTAQRACNYIMNKKQTNGRVKYPKKFYDEKQPNPQYLFPVLPENKIFTGGYLNFGLRLRHFLVIDSVCANARVIFRSWEDPHKSTKNWCSWPKCFSHGNSQYLKCPSLHIQPDPSMPEYFRIP